MRQSLLLLLPVYVGGQIVSNTNTPTSSPTLRPTSASPSLSPTQLPSHSPSSPPTKIPTVAPTSRPSPLVQTYDTCFICGNETNTVGTPDALIGPEGNQQSCMDLFEKGRDGMLSGVLCLAASQLAQESCDCLPHASSKAPSTQSIGNAIILSSFMLLGSFTIFAP